MKRTIIPGLFIAMLSCSSFTTAQQKLSKSPLKEFKELRLKTTDDAQKSSQNSADQGFALNLDKPESTQLSITIDAIETSSGAAHDGRVLFVSSKDGTLLFSTAIPNPSDLPKVVPYVGVLSLGSSHTHLVYVDPKALSLLQDRGCGPGSVCGNGGGGNPSPPPKPIVNPCGPGSQCGPGGGNPSPTPVPGVNPCGPGSQCGPGGGNPSPSPVPGVNPCGPGSACGQGRGNASGNEPKPKPSEDKNPCDATTTGEKPPKDAKPCTPDRTPTPKP